MERDFKGVWVPREIWLDKNLGWTEKLLLVEIDSLSKNGQCFASNQYFAEFFDLSKDRISKIISELSKKGYIEIKLVYKTGSKQIDKRIITTFGYRRKQLEGIGENTDTPLGENTDTPIGENAEDINTGFNNTGFNNTNNKNKKQKKNPFANAPKKPKDQNTTPYKNVGAQEEDKILKEVNKGLLELKAFGYNTFNSKLVKDIGSQKTVVDIKNFVKRVINGELYYPNHQKKKA